MPKLPNKTIADMRQSLLRDGKGHRKSGSTTLDLMPDGSWELGRYARTLCVIDRNGNVMVYPNVDGALSPSDVNAINSLTMLVLGRKHLLTKRDRQTQDEQMQ